MSNKFQNKTPKWGGLGGVGGMLCELPVGGGKGYLVSVALRPHLRVDKQWVITKKVFLIINKLCVKSVTQK